LPFDGCQNSANYPDYFDAAQVEKLQPFPYLKFPARKINFSGGHQTNSLKIQKSYLIVLLF